MFSPRSLRSSDHSSVLLSNANYPQVPSYSYSHERHSWCQLTFRCLCEHTVIEFMYASVYVFCVYGDFAGADTFSEVTCQALRFCVRLNRYINSPSIIIAYFCELLFKSVWTNRQIDLAFILSKTCFLIIFNSQVSDLIRNTFNINQND